MLCGLVALFILVNGYYLLNDYETFSPKELVLSTDGKRNYRKKYYIQINDEMIFQNLSPFRQKITGDLFGVVILRPGERFVYQYNQPGVFKFYTNNDFHFMRYIIVKPPDFGLLKNFLQ